MKQSVDEYAILQNPWWGAYQDALFGSQLAEAELTLCAGRRAYALARLHEDGWTLAAIAGAAGLTATRVWQLVSRDRRGRG